MTAEPYYTDDSVTIFAGDCLDVLAGMPAGSVDAVVTDPPYGLEFMGKDWDAPWQAGTGTGGHNAGFSAGAPAVAGVRGAIESLPSYMGSTNPTCRNCGGTRNGNDRVGRRACRCAEPIFPNTTLPRMHAFQEWCEAWAVECLRVLKPGGYMLAFGGSRTWHRLASAVEDAGFEIRDSIAWLYGQGFPKSLNIGDGRGTALKPAFEPIVVGRKPLAGTVAANVQAHGTGALNIDACRIATDGPTARPPLSTNKHEGWQRPWNEDATARAGVEARREAAHDKRDTVGRWPTNVVLDDTQAVDLDAQTGILTSGALDRSKITAPNAIYGIAPAERSGTYAPNSGGASRFFPTFRYEPKAPTAERPRGDDGAAHPTVKPLDLMRWLVRLVTPRGGLVLDPFLGSGTTAEACVIEGFRCIGIEREPAYLPLAVARLSKPIAVGLDFGESA